MADTHTDRAHSSDTFSFAATSEGACYSVRRAGRVVQVGLPLGGRPPEIPMARVANREISVVGSHGLAASDFPAVLRLVADAKLQPERLVTREVSLEEGARAIADMDKASPLGMTVVTTTT